MAVEQPIWQISRNATADLRTSQFLLVKLAAGGVALCAANADVAQGVLQNKPNINTVAEVMVVGISKAVAGAAFSEGAALMSDTSGRVITQTSTNPTIGYALAPASAANDIVSIMMK